MSVGTILIRTAELAERLDGELVGDGDVPLRGVNTLDAARDDELAFIVNEAYAKKWPESDAAATIVSRSLVGALDPDDHRPVIVVDDAELSSIVVLTLFRPPETVPEIGVHPTAWIHPDASADPTARIGPHVSVDQGAVLEAGVILFGGVRIYANVRVGQGTVIHANTVIRERCVVGREVILHQNVSIGADGFGYRPAPDGSGLQKMPHIGNVVIGNAVEIGANSCIDRGKFGSTTIGDGTKIDNLVQIAHNCEIGQSCIIAGMTGISGSTKLGDGVMMGGGSGTADHVTIGSGAKLGACTIAINDVEAGATFLGFPAQESGKTLRQWVAIRKLPELVRQMSRLTRDRE